MASDLKGIEKRLNADPAVRDQFITDPVKFLRAEGVVLPPDQEKELAAAIAKVKMPKGAQGRKPAPIRIGIFVKVGIIRGEEKI